MRARTTAAIRFRSDGRVPSRDRTANNLVLLLSLSFVYVGLFGQVYLTELILALVSITWHLAKRRASRLPRWASYLLAIGGLWLVEQLVADAARHTTSANTLRGSADIVFFLTDIYGLAVLTEFRMDRLRAVFWGIAAAGALSFFLEPNVFARSSPWKFGFAFTATVLVSLYADAAARRRRGLELIFALAVCNILLDFRSMAGILVVMGIRLLVGNSLSSRWLPAGTVVKTVLIGLFAALISLHFYATLARAGDLGASAKQKYSFQSSGKYGIILGGRPETLFEFAAIKQNPLLGQGAYPPITSGEAVEVAQEFAVLGYSNLATGALDTTVSLPIHSHVFGSWAQAGLVGALFWVLVIGVACASLLRSHPPVGSALVAFCSIELVYNVLFSPFGAGTRIIDAACLAVCISAMGTGKYVSGISQ